MGGAAGLDGASDEDIGAADTAGPADADAGAGDDVVAAASSCAAPDEPAVVDEQPAIAAVASTTPTVSSVKRALMTCLDPGSRGAIHLV